MATKKRYLAHWEDIDYYDSAPPEVKEKFGKEWSTPIFQTKRALREYQDELPTTGILSYAYTEYRIN